jgi:LacI family transcriptional regulator
MATNIKDIARLAGVAPITVSRVINNRPEVTEKTRKKVNAVIDKLHWRPNLQARALIRSKTYTISFIATDLAASFNSEVLQEAERMASKLRYGLLVMNTDDDDEQLYWAVRESLARSVDGIILCLNVNDERTVKLLQDAMKDGMRCVVLFNEVPGVPELSVDYEMAGRLAAEHLRSLGRRKCLFIHDAPDLNSDRFTEWRWRGFASLADDVDDFTVANARVPYGSAEFSDSGISLADFNGVFCQNDRCLPDVYRMAAKAGSRIPDDLAVVGCNNRNISSQLLPSASTIDIRKMDIGKQAVQRLVFTKPAYPVRGKIFQPELIVRESSTRIKH